MVITDMVQTVANRYIEDETEMFKSTGVVFDRRTISRELE